MVFGLAEPLRLKRYIGSVPDLRRDTHFRLFSHSLPNDFVSGNLLRLRFLHCSREFGTVFLWKYPIGEVSASVTEGAGTSASRAVDALVEAVILSKRHFVHAGNLDVDEHPFLILNCLLPRGFVNSIFHLLKVRSSSYR